MLFCKQNYTLFVNKKKILPPFTKILPHQLYQHTLTIIFEYYSKKIKQSLLKNEDKKCENKNEKYD